MTSQGSEERPTASTVLAGPPAPSSYHAKATAAPAPHGLRLLAWIIDVGVVMAVVIVSPQPIPLALPLGLWILYHATLVWLTQRTVGKALAGLRVERNNGQKVTAAWSFGRASLGYLGIDMLGVGVAFALIDSRHRTLHDTVFRSYVTYSDDGPHSPAVLLDRLTKYAAEQQTALKERQEALKKRKKTFSAVAALWAGLEGLSRVLRRLLNGLARMGGGSGSAPSTSVLGALSAKAAAAVVGITTAATATVVTAVPPVRTVAIELFTPRYFIGDAPKGVPEPSDQANAPAPGPESTTTTSVSGEVPVADWHGACDLLQVEDARALLRASTRADAPNETLSAIDALQRHSGSVPGSFECTYGERLFSGLGPGAQLELRPGLIAKEVCAVLLDDRDPVKSVELGASTGILYLDGERSALALTYGKLTMCLRVYNPESKGDAAVSALQAIGEALEARCRAEPNCRELAG